MEQYKLKELQLTIGKKYKIIFDSEYILSGVLVGFSPETLSIGVGKNNNTTLDIYLDEIKEIRTLWFI